MPKLDTSAIQAAMNATMPKLDTSAIQAAMNATMPKLDTSVIQAAVADMSKIQTAVAAAMPKLDTSAIQAAMNATMPKLDTSVIQAAMNATIPKLDTSVIQAAVADISRVQDAMNAAIREIDWMSIQEAIAATELEVPEGSAAGAPGPEALHAAVAVIMACLVLAFLLSELALPTSRAARDTAQTAALALDVFVEMVRRVPGLEGALILIGLMPRTRPSRRQDDSAETDDAPNGPHPERL